MLSDFKRFLMRGNVVDLAVAVVIGTAFTAIVTSIVEGMITPLVGMIISRDFSKMTFTINNSVFSYGAVINAILFFISVAAVVFFAIVRPMQTLAARRAAGEVAEADTPAPSDEVVLLQEIRDLLAQRQA